MHLLRHHARPRLRFVLCLPLPPYTHLRSDMLSSSPLDATPPLEPDTEQDADESTDTSSLITLPGSLRTALYTIENGKRHQALNTEYKYVRFALP